MTSKLTSKEIYLEVQARMEALHNKAISITTVKQLLQEFQDVISDGLLEKRTVQTRLGVFRPSLAPKIKYNHFVNGSVPERYLAKFTPSKNLKTNMRNVNTP